MAASNEEKQILYNKVKTMLGAPIRKVEITNEMFDSLFEISVENYEEVVLSWLTEHQWSSLIDKDITKTDMMWALSTRSIDYESSFAYAYSKQVGLQQEGPWELKKDYVVIEMGKQVYTIPANRQVNSVMWATPNMLDYAIMANMGGGMDFGFGGGFAQMGTGGGMGGMNNGGGGMGYPIMASFDTLLLGADLNLKNRMLRSDLTYKITAGPNGTRLLHLLSTPGSRMSFGFGNGSMGDGGVGIGGAIGLVGCYVWYYYYDTTPETVAACRRENKDIILMPNDVPLDKLDYSDFNEPTRVLIRQLLTAETKKTLGHIRGRFGGLVGLPEMAGTQNFETLLEEGNVDKKEAIEKLEARLARLTTVAMLEKKSQEAEFLNKHLKYRPLGFYVK